MITIKWLMFILLRCAKRERLRLLYEAYKNIFMESINQRSSCHAIKTSFQPASFDKNQVNSNFVRFKLEGKRM